ncbi:hypothetical protein [Arthrobacter mobilis]|uniref:Uncharacterized protein n=1 Tax=Arthrobacter mobilis TaxID=2724944 RepID=A0A7X6K5V9_9MICC|nr:hypothetical protein [Arthrobacter mobilis]NKX56185.1 hypothetical protein [Arthrobacter mobilis]
MSQDSQPPRSRREARLQARLAPSGSDQRGRVALETPRSLDAVAAPARGAAPAGAGGGAAETSAGAGSERASQVRARDREARQVLNALTGSMPKIVQEPAAVPTRRQLRMQQLEREHVGGLGAGGAASVVPAPAEGTRDQAAQLQQSGAGDLEGPGMVADAAYNPERPALRGGRRDRRERRESQPDDGANLTAEDAVAARDELMNHAAGLAQLLETEAGQDPSQVDLKLLAEQKALAERAAILNRRAADKQRLSEQTKQGREAAVLPAVVRDPVSAPMEFVRLPGSDRQVMRPAATSFVPVTTDPAPVQQPAKSEAPAAAGTKSGRTPGSADNPQSSGSGAAGTGTQAVPKLAAAPKAAPAPRTQPAAKAKPAPKPEAVPRTQPVAAVKPKAGGSAPRTQPVSTVRPAPKASSTSGQAPEAATADQSGARSRLLAKAEAAAGSAASVQPRRAEASASSRAEAPASRRGEAPAARGSDAPATRRSQAGRRSEAPATRRSQTPATRQGQGSATRRSPAPATRRPAPLPDIAEGGAQPLRATRAHGLEPLDARTAGLAKANRDRLLVIGSLALGGLAFALGLIMMIIGMSN